MDIANIVMDTPPPRLPLTQDEREAEAARIYAESGVNVLVDLPGIFDLEIVHAVTFPHESLRTAYQSGCAEPWTTQLVTSLLIASNERNVLECGGFMGQTSAWLALALERLGGGNLTVVDIDPDRGTAINDRLSGLPLTRTAYQVVVSDILKYIPTLADKSVGFVWVDDCHEMHHVEREINLLWPKMKPGGIMTFHDVHGVCQLHKVVNKYGGYSIDLPRLGAAGGVGIIQVPL